MTCVYRTRASVCAGPRSRTRRLGSTPRPATSSIERAVEPSRGWDDPTDPRWDRAVGRGLVRESRPVKRQTDRHPPPRAIDPPRDRARPRSTLAIGSGRGGTRWVVVVSLIVEMCVHPSRARVRWCANKYIDEGSRPVRDHPLHRVVCLNECLNFECVHVCPRARGRAWRV